jgi:Uncharacterized protein conserved in bacteria
VIFELIPEVQHDGSRASTNPDHMITVPSDRSGYHVILAVWDVADTVNAFYNAIDVNVTGEGVPDSTPPVDSRRPGRGTSDEQRRGVGLARLHG